MQKVAGPGIRFIDPAPAVARQLVHVMTEEHLYDGSPAPDGSCDTPDVTLLSSGDSGPLHHLFGMIYR